MLRHSLKIYKKYISPLIGARCRFHPSCSDYSVEAIEKHGWLYGVYLTIKRIVRCNPYSKGWFDPVPERDLKSKKFYCSDKYTF